MDLKELIDKSNLTPIELAKCIKTFKIITDNNTEYVVYVHEYATKYTFTVKYSLNGYFNIVLDNTSYIHNIIVEFIKNTIKMDKLCQ